MRTNRSLLLIALTALSVSWLGHAADPAPGNTALGLAVSPAGQGAIIRLKTRIPILDYTSYDADPSTVVAGSSMTTWPRSANRPTEPRGCEDG